jgi:hypothetical protein
MLNVCGTDCIGCPQLNKDCQDTCQNLKGKVFWTKYVNVEVCPVYKCVKEKYLANCGYCAKIPCDWWFSLKDPSMSDEQHREGVIERVKKLKARIKDTNKNKS